LVRYNIAREVEEIWSGMTMPGMGRGDLVGHNIGRVEVEDLVRHNIARVERGDLVRHNIAHLGKADLVRQDIARLGIRDLVGHDIAEVLLNTKTCSLNKENFH